MRGEREVTQQVVTFSIGHQEYALPLSAVLQVVRLPALLTLAGAELPLCGLLNLHGHYLPAVDGRSLIGEPSAYDLNSQVLIVGDAGEPRVALLVDQVHNVATLSAAQLTELPGGTAADVLGGVLTLDGGSVLLLDIAALEALTPGVAS